VSFFSKIKFLTKIHNRKQRSSLENIEHKNDLYSKFSSDKFNQNLNSVKDIQGWRNRLIDSIPNFNEDVNFIDLGCGLGDKTYRIINNSNLKYKNIFLVDFSNKATKIFSNFCKNDNVSIYNCDVILALDKIEDNSLDIIIAFGFIHELDDRKSFFLKLKKKMKQNSLLYISDNDLYFSANELNTELQECKVDNCVYMRILKLFNIHIFYRVSYKNNFSKFLSFYHQERSDKIISISSTFNNVLKKI
tara:strand:+ start:1064 stop:1804 length:741 start_codon:yes stop_codon:yes gene_type:complete